MGDWNLLARLTTDADPLVLPAIAAYYATDAPHRVSRANGGDRRGDRPAPGARGARARPPGRAARRGRGAAALAARPGAPAGARRLGALRAALERLLALVPAGDPLVVECGSGESTIAIARLLRARGRGRLQALEHYPAWASEIRRRLEAEGLADQAAVIDAPLLPNPAAEPGCEWYSPAALERVGEPINVLLVDGPPSGEPGRERSRYPALPALEARLAPRAAVVLDDAGRPGERWVLARWEADHGIRFERLSEGLALGRVGATILNPRALNRPPGRACRAQKRWSQPE